MHLNALPQQHEKNCNITEMQHHFLAESSKGIFEFQSVVHIHFNESRQSTNTPSCLLSVCTECMTVKVYWCKIILYQSKAVWFRFITTSLILILSVADIAWQFIISYVWNTDAFALHLQRNDSIYYFMTKTWIIYIYFFLKCAWLNTKQNIFLISQS